ncbi:MAG: hypothetical protein LPJ87_11860 [Zoogloeaceae bacterium]|jgi:hypothetical protein|nr:hypothetical protein [Zoogloeaceae bacterium]
MNLPKLSLFPLMDAAEPLGKRAPAVDEHGKALSDFMMIIPGLRDKPRQLIQQTLYEIHSALACFQHAVVFAELNLKLNLLWVSIRPLHGIRIEIATAVQNRVPEARLVSHI